MDEILTEQWARIIMHLPYAFQAKRMFPDVFRHDRKHLDSWSHIEEAIGMAPEESDFETPEEWEKGQWMATAVQSQRLKISSNSLKTESRRVREHLHLSEISTQVRFSSL